MPTADSISSSNSKYGFLFKGSVGFGKTLAAASFAVEGPVFLAYFDKKSPVELEKFFKTIIKRPELLKNIEYEVYGASNVHQYLNRLIDFTKYCDKFAVITDSLTTLTAAAINWSMGFRNPSGPRKDPLNPSAVMTKPEMADYQIETNTTIQAIDLCKMLNCHVIWTAHPLPKLDMSESVGASGRDQVKVTKTTSLVTYGSRIAGMVPGNFTEIYHFSQVGQWDASAGVSKKKFIVNTEAQGDEFAKTALQLPSELDITNDLFYSVWKSALERSLK